MNVRLILAALAASQVGMATYNLGSGGILAGSFSAACATFIIILALGVDQ
jgi:hypothetical protein